MAAEHIDSSMSRSGYKYAFTLLVTPLLSTHMIRFFMKSAIDIGQAWLSPIAFLLLEIAEKCIMYNYKNKKAHS